MKYPISYPFASFLSRVGVKLVIRIDFIYDKEVDVFLATSRDIEGLIVEADNFKELQHELKEVIVTLLELNHSKNTPDTDIVLTSHAAMI